MKRDGGTLLGLFCTALATLLLETLLTRIFSFTMWYHFAFFAVSLALFGQTAGALFLHLRPERFPLERGAIDLARASFAFAACTAGAFLLHLACPFVVAPSLVSLVAVLLTYLLLATPFFFSGLVMALVFCRRPAGAGLLYAADLGGAAAGCLLLGPLLEILDGPSAVFFVAALAGVGTVAFARRAGHRGMARRGLVLAVVLALFALTNAHLARRGHAPLRILWAKSRFVPPPDWVRWNAYSRVAVRGGDGLRATEAGWGLSARTPEEREITYWVMDIDGSASTVITAFDGGLDGLAFLEWDVTNLPHHLRREGTVCIVGAGGGRDVLAALRFRQRQVTAIELNGHVLEALNVAYGDRSGHLDRRPEVDFVHDEARSWLAGTDRRFDLIQVSFIDTWAATAAGAFVLSENGLYTTEAWRLFLDRLRPGGLLAFSRWYHPPAPAELWRCLSLAGAALRARGITRLEDHVLVVANPPAPGRRAGVATVVVSPDALTDEDLDRTEALCRRTGFRLLQSRRGGDPTMTAVLRGSREVLASLPVDASPPTDDRPFFFHMLRFRDVFDRSRWSAGTLVTNLKAVAFLLVLLVLVVLLAVVFLGLPLVARRNRRPPWTGLAYFASIGLAFMLAEIAMLQRLSIFLGHPGLGLSVTLFALLLGSGLGSLSTHRLDGSALRRRLLLHLLLLCPTLLALDHLGRTWLPSLAGSSVTERSAVAALLLLPPGFLMGAAFPIGLRLWARGREEGEFLPWLLAANGACSVVASVLAVVLSLARGISFVMNGSAMVYAIALLLVWTGRSASPRTGSVGRA